MIRIAVGLLAGVGVYLMFITAPAQSDGHEKVGAAVQGMGVLVLAAVVLLIDVGITLERRCGNCGRR